MRFEKLYYYLDRGDMQNAIHSLYGVFGLWNFLDYVERDPGVMDPLLFAILGVKDPAARKMLEASAEKIANHCGGAAMRIHAELKDPIARGRRYVSQIKNNQEWSEKS